MEETTPENEPVIELNQLQDILDPEKEVNIKYFMYRGLQKLGEAPNEDTDREVVGLRRSKSFVIGKLLKLRKDGMKNLYWVRRIITEKRKVKDVPKNFKKGK